MDNALREFCETVREQAGKLADAVWKAAEALAETLRPLIEQMAEALAQTLRPLIEQMAEALAQTLRPLIEQMAEALAEILPTVIEDVRRRAAYTPRKKDAPKKQGAVITANLYARRRFCARSRI